MKQILIVPDINNLDADMELVDRYSFGFEYNDFFYPDVLDDEKRLNEIIEKYKSYKLPEYSTVHGAFFDVIPFSIDSKIREISMLRIEQSIDVALRLGAKAVIFHTNYNPFLNSAIYVEGWIKENVKIWTEVVEKYTDINIYLENMFDMTPDIMLKLGESLCKYENFGICLDYAHASLGKVQPHIWVEKLGKYIKHIHINDNDLVSDLHLAWGDGKIKRELFYESYEKFMSSATVLIETSLMENKLQSINVLKKEGFIDK
ncbi:MAG: sugar phosphate isomerase/epimerase [Lachnospiraceae bacterium]|nr:sugar phosphate isomerase/epimerase [Lachnospiraceae bacterium]